MMHATRRFGTDTLRHTFLSIRHLKGNSKYHQFAHYTNRNSYEVRTFTSISTLIKELRESTGAPMMECKKAIDAVNGGSIEEATEWLRKNGSAKVLSKVSGREASEGLVGICISSEDSKDAKAAIVKVSSETDFASRSDTFSTLVKNVAEATVNASKMNAHEGTYSIDVDHLLTAEMKNDDGDNCTLKDNLEEAILAIRENLKISEAIAMSKTEENSILAGYVHGKVCDFAGTSAALVEIASIAPDNTIDLEEIGKKLAMHVVAAKPIYLSPSEVPEDIVKKEKTILMEQLADSGKPAHILEKIVDGRLRKFYESVCLTEQTHMVEEGDLKVSKALSKSGVVVKSYLYNSITP